MTEMNITVRYADSVVAQETASAILNSLKEKKTSKISAMNPSIELVSAKRDGKTITVNVKNGDREGVVELTDSVITAGELTKKISENVQAVFADQFEEIDVDKFGQVVVAMANKVIERAAKAAENAKLHPAKKVAKKVATPLF